MNIHLLPDPHLGHNGMMRLACGRPENYEEQVIQALTRIPEKDILICLGDVALSNETAWHEKFLSATKARKWLILGNHDKKSLSWYLDQGWDCVANELTINRYGKTILFSHTPKPLPSITKPIVNIHAHFHNNPPNRWEKYLKNYITPHHIHCCLETAAYTPIPLKTAVHDPMMKTLHIRCHPPQSYNQKKLPGHTNADKSQKWIPIEKCKNQYLYYIAARNAPLGIYQEEKKAFLISRWKFKENFLFPEYHWDTGEPHGTAKPLIEIEKSPETNKDPEIITYLNKKTKDLTTSP
jgi:calcineurin-like phosphoesterase family protein